MNLKQYRPAWIVQAAEVVEVLGPTEVRIVDERGQSFTLSVDVDPEHPPAEIGSIAVMREDRQQVLCLPADFFHACYHGITDAVLIGLALMLLLISPAMAQDLLVPAPPTAGLSPLQGWILTIAAGAVPVVLGLFMPLVRSWVNARQRALDAENANQAAQAKAAEAQATATNAGMVNSAITRGANLADVELKKGAAPAAAIQVGVDYAKNAYPDVISAIPQATDSHLANAVTAELNKITNQAAPAAVVMSGNLPGGVPGDTKDVQSVNSGRLSLT